MQATLRPPAWKTWLAFAIVYFVWGSTFLAIRVGVREVPPYLLAGLRFSVAGIVLFTWMLARKTALPTRREWVSASILAVLIFAVDYGLLFWAEQRVPSGVAAVMMATIPVLIALLEITFLRSQRLTFRLALALIGGICGVGILMSHSMAFGETPMGRSGAVALLVASVSWSIAAILPRKLPLPSSKGMSSAAQMLIGGAMLLLVSAVRGEFRGFHVREVSGGAWFALVYLIVPGSIVAFTAYMWLLHHESPTRVVSYAYVNPVVAVVLGHFLGGELVGPRTLIGTLFVLASVVAITTIPRQDTQAASIARELEEVAE